MTYLIFKIHTETFATKVEYALEVLSEYKISEVPDAPEYIEGVINYRGEIIPAIDFRRKFNFPKFEDEDQQQQIIVFNISENEKNIKFGAIIDKVQNVYETEELKERPEFGSKYNPEYLEGMIKQNDDFIMLLNIKKIFTDTEINIISQL